jgi:chromosome segregation ATPase
VLSTATGSPLPVEKLAPEPAKLAVVQKAPTPQIKVEPLPESRSATAVTSAPAAKPTLAAVEPSLQRKRDEERRRILEVELKQEEEGLERARGAVSKEQQNPQLIAAVRAAQAAAEPTAAQMAEFRSNIDKASGRIRGLQATVAEHEKNIEALKKELGALKP